MVSLIKIALLERLTFKSLKHLAVEATPCKRFLSRRVVMIDDLGEDRRLGVRTNLIEVARPMLFTERVYHVVKALTRLPN